MSQFLVKEVRLARGGRKPMRTDASHHGTHHNGWKNVQRRSMMSANRVNQSVRGRPIAGGK
jgi:hypothetical protein